LTHTVYTGQPQVYYITGCI